MEDVDIGVGVDAFGRFGVEVNACDPDIVRVATEMIILHERHDPEDFALVKDGEAPRLRRIVDHHLEPLHTEPVEVGVDVIDKVILLPFDLSEMANRQFDHLKPQSLLEPVGV